MKEIKRVPVFLEHSVDLLVVDRIRFSLIIFGGNVGMCIKLHVVQ